MGDLPQVPPVTGVAQPDEHAHPVEDREELEDEKPAAGDDEE